MQIITLTTDYGYRDPYAALLKAELLEKIPELQVLELTHGIEPYNISHAELVVRQSWSRFDVGSIHLICVREYYTAEPEWIYAGFEGHHFIAPNHGLLPILAHGYDASYRRIHNDQKQVPVFAVQSIQQGIDPEQWSSADFELQKALKLRPVVKSDRLRGSVVYTDHYGNVITNIERREMEEWLKDRPYKIALKRSDQLAEVSAHFGEVPIGEPLAYWTSAGLLGIAVHNGHAQSLLNFEPNDVVDIQIQ